MEIITDLQKIIIFIEGFICKNTLLNNEVSVKKCHEELANTIMIHFWPESELSRKRALKLSDIKSTFNFR